MLPLLQILDLVATGLACAILFFLGIADAKYRSVPGGSVIVFLIGGAVFTLLRIILGGAETVLTVEFSVLVAGILALAMTALVHFTGMVGIGDVLTVLAISLMSPYPPLGFRVKMFPATIPIATIVATLMIYLKIRKTTIVLDQFPPGFRRVSVRKAFELKNADVITEYPVYVEGLGYVYEKVFNGSPVENTKKILRIVPNDAIVFTLPNFPFLYYFALSFIPISAVEVVLGVLELVGVIG
mgnify:CR=1 FL=1